MEINLAYLIPEKLVGDFTEIHFSWPTKRFRPSAIAIADCNHVGGVVSGKLSRKF